MAAEDIARTVIAGLDDLIARQVEPVIFTFPHGGSFDANLFGQITKLLINHYRPNGWRNVEIGRVTMRDGHSYVDFQLIRDA